MNSEEDPLRSYKEKHKLSNKELEEITLKQPRPSEDILKEAKILPTRFKGEEYNLRGHKQGIARALHEDHRDIFEKIGEEKVAEETAFTDLEGELTEGGRGLAKRYADQMEEEAFKFLTHRSLGNKGSVYEKDMVDAVASVVADYHPEVERTQELSLDEFNYELGTTSDPDPENWIDTGRAENGTHLDSSEGYGLKK